MSPQRHPGSVDILRLLAGRNTPLRLAETRQAPDLRVSSLHNIVQAMVDAEVVTGAGEAFGDPHMQAHQMPLHVGHPLEGCTLQPGFAARLGGVPARRPASTRPRLRPASTRKMCFRRWAATRNAAPNSPAAAPSGAPCVPKSPQQPTVPP